MWIIKRSWQIVAKFNKKNGVEGDFCKAYRSCSLQEHYQTILQNQFKQLFEPTCNHKKCLLWDIQRYFFGENLRLFLRDGLPYFPMNIFSVEVQVGPSSQPNQHRPLSHTLVVLLPKTFTFLFYVDCYFFMFTYFFLSKTCPSLMSVI